ncbi:MAG TPA: enoyl-CoA hydratase/isomerase family protein [Nitrospirota bacterium]|nr:enoyl-CoA hydratase/isomerase family protein [Nitrospirota bacterium]
MSSSCVSVECKDWISTVTIDNPPDNYLDKDVLSKLNKTISEMISSKTELRVVLLIAKGKNFSAGIDYTGFVKMSKDEAGHFAEVGYNLLKHIESLPVPVIAAVKGETTGAGLGLALAADIRIASADTVFSFPEAQFGVPPIFGSSQRLYKTVGIGRAKELLFTGRRVDVEEALRIGLVNKVVPPDMLDEEANRLAVRIGGNSLSSLRSIKMLVNFGLNEGYDVGLLQEVTAFSEAFNPDTKQWERL